MYDQNRVYKEALKWLCFIVLAILLGRITKGAFFLVLVIVACGAALLNKVSFALSMFVLFPTMVILNPIILPKDGALISIVLRFGSMLVGLCLAATSSRRPGNSKLPLGLLFVYLLCASISSYAGYFPAISYMKIANFAVFLFGVWFGTRNLQDTPEDLFRLRAFLMAIVLLFVYGSLILYPFPGISTLNGLDLSRGIMGTDGVGVEEATMLIQESSQGQLFCGITYQSQTLSGVLACCFIWIVCDMLLVEQRIRWPHVVMVITTPILIFMTRSRMGLLVVLVGLLLVYGYMMRRVRLPLSVKQKIGVILRVGAILMVIGMALAEIKSNAITRWVRKVDDLGADNRSFTEAITSSRMGLIEMNMHDFKRNPLLGSGFQVAWWHPIAFANTKGIILSAPIEKGLLPLMVLGETGMIGLLFFLVFVVSFCSFCARRGWYATIVLFWSLFASNMAEATFFSPGGPGGVEWVITIVGGFVIDMCVVSMRNQARAFYS